MSVRAASLWYAALVLSLPGCGSETESSDLGQLSGRISTMEERAPVVGARIVLMDPSSNSPTSVPAVTDQEGFFHLGGIPPGWHYLVVYSGRRFLYDPIDQPFLIGAGDDVEKDVLVASYPFLEEGHPVVRGRVFDAESGEPLAGAYVSVGSSDLAFLFSGIGFPWESVTDLTGSFVITEAPIAYSRTTHLPIGVFPVTAARRGYRPAATGSTARNEFLPLPVEGDTIEVSLFMPPGMGTGRVTGRVLHGDAPIAGVPVALSLIDTSTASSGSDLPDRGVLGSGRLDPLSVVPDANTVSTTDGVFEISHVAPGRYEVHAGYLPDDGWIDPIDNQNVSIEIRDNQVVDVIARVMPAIRIVSPAHGVTVHTGQPQLTWTSIPGVDHYRVAFSEANSFILSHYFDTSDLSVTAPPGFWGDGDRARWTVQAYRSGRAIGGSETIASFQVSTR